MERDAHVQMVGRPDPNQVGEGELTEEQLIYKENILDHYKHPRNKRVIEGALHYTDINPVCGDMIEAFVKIHDGKIEDISFQGKGCAISQASISMLTEKIKGMPVEDVKKIGRQEILAMLGIPIGYVRTKCAMLGLRATQRTIQ